MSYEIKKEPPPQKKKKKYPLPTYLGHPVKAQMTPLPQEREEKKMHRKTVVKVHTPDTQTICKHAKNMIKSNRLHAYDIQ